MRCKCGGYMYQNAIAFEDEDGNECVEYEAECDDCGRLIN